MRYIRSALLDMPIVKLFYKTKFHTDTNNLEKLKEKLEKMENVKKFEFFLENQIVCIIGIEVDGFNFILEIINNPSGLEVITKKDFLYISIESLEKGLSVLDISIRRCMYDAGLKIQKLLKKRKF